MVQTAEVANLIASTLLATYKESRKDVSLNWRGNPALELGNLISVKEYEKDTETQNGIFYVTKNKYQFDGTLKCDTEGRKVYTEYAEYQEVINVPPSGLEWEEKINTVDSEKEYREIT